MGVRTETAAVAGQMSIILGVRTKPDPNAGEEGTRCATLQDWQQRNRRLLRPGDRRPRGERRPVCAASPRRSWTGCCRSPAISTYEFSMLLRATRADVELVQYLL